MNGGLRHSQSRTTGVEMEPLHSAAYDGDPGRVRACLQAGADPNAYDESGYRPLHWVAFRGLVGQSPAEVARLLLEAGADPHAKTRCEVGNSALVLACQAGAEPVIRLLAESGADINAICGNTTPLIAASMSGCAEAVRLLLSLGADMTAKGPFGMTALEWAESNGFDGVVETLNQ
jgi:ankyrin repeat protein